MNASEIYQQRFQTKPEFCVRAPGRVNLIGEHIDYNGGHVLPFAIAKGIEIAATPRKDGQFRLYAAQFDEIYEGALPSAKTTDIFWANYVFGVIHEFEKLGHSVPGLDAVIDGDIPLSSGLSSSAALEVGTAWLLQQILGTKLTRMEIALVGQRAENRYVGVNCGIMDQAASALGQAGRALLLDCNSLNFEQPALELKGEAVLVVAHSGIRRGLSHSAYNERRGACDAAIDGIRKETGKNLACLCDATLEDLEASKSILDNERYRRARHAITEEQRVRETVQALAVCDYQRVGELLNASHFSLRDDYDVSCPELDELTARIRQYPGVLGSRLTGAGFGGCTVSLVKTEAAEGLMEDLKKNYYAAHGMEALVFATASEEGVRSL